MTAERHTVFCKGPVNYLGAWHHCRRNMASLRAIASTRIAYQTSFAQLTLAAALGSRSVISSACSIVSGI